MLERFQGLRWKLLQNGALNGLHTNRRGAHTFQKSFIVRCGLWRRLERRFSLKLPRRTLNACSRDQRLHAYIAYMQYIVGPCISFEEHFCCFPTSVVFRFLRLVVGADDADCCLLLLEKLFDLARAVYGWNKFREFSSTCPSVFRPFTALATAPYLGGPFSGPWDVCSLLTRVASSNNYKFTAFSRKAAMFPTKTGQRRRNKLT